MRRKRRGSRRRSHRRNPAMGGTLAAVKSGFNLNTIKKAAVVSAGAIGNGYLTNYVKGFLGSYGQNQYLGYAVGLGTAGLSSMAIRKIGKPEYADSVALGGVLGVLATVLQDFGVVQKIQAGVSGLGRYLGDSLTSGQLRTVRPLQGYRGVGDFLTAGAVGRSSRIGDYLTQDDFNGILPLTAPSADQIIASEFGAN